MVGLLVQSVAFTVAGVFLFAVLRGPDERRRTAFWITLAVAAFLAVQGTIRFRGQWVELDKVRDVNAARVADDRRRECLKDTGTDAGFYGWMSGRVPEDEPYYLAMRPDIAATGGDLCVTATMLPRRRMDRVEDARYIVLWDEAPADVLESARARGAVEEAYRPQLRLLRVP